MGLFNIDIKGGLNFGLCISATRFTESFHGFEKVSNPSAAGAVYLAYLLLLHHSTNSVISVGFRFHL